MTDLLLRDALVKTKRRRRWAKPSSSTKRTLILICHEYPPEEDVPIPTLADVLGVPRPDFEGLTYRGEKLFAKYGLGAHYLTTVALVTIVRERLPDIRVETISFDAFQEADFAIPYGLADDVFAVGISTTFVFSASVLGEACSKARALFPEAALVVGGPGLALNRGWFRDIDADFGVVSDAERAFPELLSFLRTGLPSDPAAIPNLAFWAGDGTVVETASEQTPCDHIPTPRWDLLGKGEWPRAIYYESQRGCAFRCTFCSFPNQVPKWVMKSAARMAEEFRFYRSKGVQEIKCFDSTMVTPPKRMEEFCALLKEMDLGIRWSCYAQPRHLQSLEFTKALFEAGCRWVSLGVESNDDSVQRYMKKYLSRDKIDRAIRNAQEAGMLCKAFFLVGFPGETAETHRNTIEGILDQKPDFVSLSTFEVRDRAAPILGMTDNFMLHVDEGDRPYWKHAGMDRDEAARQCQMAEWEIVFRSERSIVMPIVSAARVEFGLLSRDAVTFARHRMLPILAEYGRFLAIDPLFDVVDTLVARPESIPMRSRTRGMQHRDQMLRLWDEACTLAGSAPS